MCFDPLIGLSRGCIPKRFTRVECPSYSGRTRSRLQQGVNGLVGQGEVQVIGEFALNQTFCASVRTLRRRVNVRSREDVNGHLGVAIAVAAEKGKRNADATVAIPLIQ